MQAALDRGYESGSVLYMALELSNRKWKLGFSNGLRMRCKSIEARDQARLLEEVLRAKRKLGLSAQARVICCYEAGRGGGVCLATVPQCPGGGRHERLDADARAKWR